MFDNNYRNSHSSSSDKDSDDDNDDDVLFVEVFIIIKLQYQTKSYKYKKYYELCKCLYPFIYTNILHHPTCIINSHLYSSNIVQCMD